jgi:putative tricarboxylic transport membrane protein
MADRILGVIGLALAAFYIWQATLIQVSFISDPVGAKTFPIIIGLLLGASSLVIMLRPGESPQWPSLSRLAELGIAVGVLFFYAYILPEIGFVIATAGAAAFLSWRLDSRPLQAVLSGAATSMGIYVVFHVILGLSLAEGPFGF